MKQDVEIKARAKAFSGEHVKEHKFLVSADGSVRVWDAVAGHYTNCNSLSDLAKNRIRKMVN